MLQLFPAIDIGIYEYVDKDNRIVGYFGRYNVTGPDESWEFAALFVDYPGLCPSPRGSHLADLVSATKVGVTTAKTTVDLARKDFLATLKASPNSVERYQIEHFIEGKLEDGFGSTADPAGDLNWSCGKKVESLRKGAAGAESAWLYGTRFTRDDTHATRYGYRDVFVYRPAAVAYPNPNDGTGNYLDTHGPATNGTYSPITTLAAFKAATSALEGQKVTVRAWFVKPGSLSGYFAAA